VEYRSDLIFFFVRKSKGSGAKIYKSIWLEKYFEDHKNLRRKGVEKLFRNFDHFFYSQKYLFQLFLSFIFTAFEHHM
jgi:hypothetical protein